MQSHTKQYKEYLESLLWHAKREAALARAGRKCQRCPNRNDLEVHHLHYETLGNERPQDLEVLCIECHTVADDQRRRTNQRKQGMKTYARKKYGEDWHSIMDMDAIAEEFNEWRENMQ